MQSSHHLMLPLVLLGAAPAAQAQVQPEIAKRYFDEVTALCERDAGRLWGVSLCGPMVIFDAVTGTRATSQPEPEGPAPRFVGFADGPVSWGGARWFLMPLARHGDYVRTEGVTWLGSSHGSGCDGSSSEVLRAVHS